MQSQGLKRQWDYRQSRKKDEGIVTRFTMMKNYRGQVFQCLWESSFVRAIRFWVFTIQEKVTGYSHMRRIFFEKTGYSLDLKNPLSFNQKICWKKVHDRNPLMPIVADKFLVREYLHDVLGEEEAGKYLIPLLYVTDDPHIIPFDTLPDEYIIKPNHGSGTNIIIQRGEAIGREQIIAQCKNYLKQPYGSFKHEWAYQKIKRKIVIEPLLRDDNGDLPKDYKFHVFHGTCHLIQVDQDRLTDHVRTLYDRDWNNLHMNYKYQEGTDIKKPETLDDMLSLVERLGRSFDYIRVDLYNIRGTVYFGELTNYPESGYGRFTPTSLDFELGSEWQITPEYWKKEK